MSEEKDVVVTDEPVSAEPSGENSENLFNMFSKKILYQLSREKYDIENQLRRHYDEEVEIKRSTLEKEFQMRKESLENQMKMEFEQRWKRREIENEKQLKETERRLLEQSLQRSTEIDKKWEAELAKMQKNFEDELLRRDSEYRERENEKLEERFQHERTRHEQFESQVKGNYESLMKQYQAEVDKILQGNEEENEKLRLKLKQEKADFEMKVYKKYQNLLEQKEKDTKVLLTDRENQLLNYDHLKNKKLMNQLKEKEQERLEKEKVLSARHEKQFSELRTITREQIDNLLTQIEHLKKEKTDQQVEMNKLEVKFREIQHNMDMWKLEYHKSTMEKFQKLLFEIELNAKKEMEEFARRQIQQYENHLLLELKQKDTELRQYERKEKDFKVQAMESQRKSRDNSEAFSREGGTQKLKKFKLRLLELWDVLKISPVERFKFIWNCHSFNRVTDETILYFKNEIQRLTEKLPLMETIKRREFVKKKLTEMFKSTKRNIDSTKVNELNKELKRLNDILLTNLPNYENRWNEVFTYDGKQSYLKHMNQENRLFS